MIKIAKIRLIKTGDSNAKTTFGYGILKSCTAKPIKFRALNF